MNISITNNCNKRCKYCFQKEWYLAKSPEDIKEMSLSNLERIIKITPDYVPLKFLGGEPFLYTKLEGLFKLLKKYNKKAGFISNCVVNSNIIKDIIIKYKDYIDFILINNDYENNQEELFYNNLKCLDGTGIQLNISTTLYPDKYFMQQSVDRIIKTLSLFDNIRRIRFAPMTPNYTKIKSYDYSIDILDGIIKILMNIPNAYIGFDCSLTSCEIQPEVINIFKKMPNNIELPKTDKCNNPPLDILVDNSAIWCSSAKFIKVNNIFDYNNLDEVAEALIKKRDEYWNNNELACSYKNCNYYNTGNCLGLCAGKNNAMQTGLYIP